MYKSVFLNQPQNFFICSMKSSCFGVRFSRTGTWCKQLWGKLRALKVGLSPPGEMLHLLLSLIRWQRSRDAFNVESLLSVAGSMTAVNLLSVSWSTSHVFRGGKWWRVWSSCCHFFAAAKVLPHVKHIHFFDMNPCAISWGKMLLQLIQVPLKLTGWLQKGIEDIESRVRIRK